MTPEEAGLPELDVRSPGPYLEVLGLLPEHVQGMGVAEPLPGVLPRVIRGHVIDRPRVVVVTKGGVKLVLPGDEARALGLSDMERGIVPAVPAPPPASPLVLPAEHQWLNLPCWCRERVYAGPTAPFGLCRNGHTGQAQRAGRPAPRPFGSGSGPSWAR